MKKKLIIALYLYVASLITAHSQDKTAYKVGLIGGLNAGQISTPSLNNTTGLLWDYNAGIALEQRFSTRFALAYELKYTRQGSKDKVSGILGNDKSISQYEYINIPVLIRYRPKGERAFIEFGGQASYFLKGRSYFASKETQSLALQNISKLDAGIIGGVGYRFGEHFVLDARYYYGMKKIRTDFTAPNPATGIPMFYTAVPQYHRVWSLNFTYYF